MAFVRFMVSRGIGPNPSPGSCHGSFQISSQPSADTWAILVGAQSHTPSLSLTPAIGSGAPSLA
eukprot:1585957-Heterocapsa_arctica.AAC.1